MQKLHILYTPTDRWWGKLLKPNYGHIELLMEDLEHGALFNIKSSGLQLELIEISTVHDFLDQAVRIYGTRLHSVRVPKLHATPAPLGLFTCVEFTKRILGIRAWWVQTPWQLHRYIERHLT